MCYFVLKKSGNAKVVYTFLWKFTQKQKVTVLQIRGSRNPESFINYSVSIYLACNIHRLVSMMCFGTQMSLLSLSSYWIVEEGIECIAHILTWVHSLLKVHFIKPMICALSYTHQMAYWFCCSIYVCFAYLHDHWGHMMVILAIVTSYNDGMS